MLRAGGAGSNTAADHIEASRLALAQLPRHLRRKVLIRADSGGGTHGFLHWLTAKSRPPALLGRHDDYRGHAERDPQGPGGFLDAGLRRRRAGPGRGVGRRHHRDARPVVLAGRDAGHRPQGTPAPWARSCGSPTSTGTGSPPSPPTRRRASSRTWSCCTGAGPAARTGSAAPRTPGCATCPSRASPRTSCGARSSPWPASCWPGPRCSP